MNRSIVPILTTIIALAYVTNTKASSLDDQIDEFSKSPNAQSESTASSILKTGLNEHRSAEAFAAAQPWLTRNRPTKQDTLFYAGRVAEFSGEPLTAIGYYRRMLKADSIDRNMGETATGAVYRLLLGTMRDNNAAYLFMREEGNRLRTFGRAKQYDRWFIEQAKLRMDIIALCDRLAAIHDGSTSDLDRYTDDLEWVCEYFEQFHKEEQALYDAAERLAGASKLPSPFKARLRWPAAVMPYNMQLDELREANTPADPKLTDGPIAAAAELLKADPDQGAILVAKGWGVEYDHHHSGNCQKRFDIEGDRKLAQLLAVVPRMSPDKRDDLLAFQIAQNRVKFDPAAVRKLVLQYPEMLNTLTAADVPLFDETLTVEEAKKLAPIVARSPNPHAAIIRAVAAVGNKNFSEIAAEVLKSQMWRFEMEQPKDTVLKIAENGAEMDRPYQEVWSEYEEQCKKPDSSREQLKKKCSPEASTSDHLSAFSTLEKDLLSAAPSIPGALPLFDQLFTNSSDPDKIQMLKSLLSSVETEREYLFRRALEHSGFEGRWSVRWDSTIDDNWEHYHHSIIVRTTPELADYLQDMLQKQIKAGNVSELVLGAWLHCVDPKKPEAEAMMKSLLASPAYQKVDPAYHRLAAHNRYFDYLALTPELGMTDPRYVSRELLALPEDATPKAVASALKTVVERLRTTPIPIAPYGLQPVATLPELDKSTRELALSLFDELSPPNYPSRQGYEQLGQRLVNDLRETDDFNAVEPYLPGLMRAAAAPDDGRANRLATTLIDFAETALEAGASSIARSIAKIGLETLEINRTDNSIAELTARIRAVSGKASIAIGIIDIPVDELDPAYPIYKSQAEFALGNHTAAWDLYDKNVDQLQPVIQNMTIDYCLWLLERNINNHDSERAEALVKELMIWSRQEAGAFSPLQEAELKIAYADAAFQKGNLQTARAWYRRVADAEQHRDTPMQYKAILRSVKVDRVSKDFGSANTDLDKLMLVHDDHLRMQVHFARAEILFDQENYAEANNEVTAVLKHDPSHADALILLGEIQLKMRQLVDASEIELGVSQENEIIVPGETIKINLDDPTLSISGVTADIEVEIWSTSGDRERVMLHQLGDDKTKFRAEVPTRLAPPTPDDKVLQVLGRDGIRYGYSKRFREKMTDLPPDPDIVIGVASDARLDFSAGAFPPREGERRLNLEELGVSTAQQALGTRQVRPGNPVYVRVFDPDQSRTADADEISVSLHTSSGDIIPQLQLKETETHSGEFQAIIPTGPAQTLAYASESAPGRDPNMVISATPYPGWAGEVGSKAEARMFSIDLNDNVPLDKMTIRCGDSTQAPTHFVLQTSMNGRDWMTRTRYPDDPAPWDGRPRISSFPTYSRGIAISEPEDRHLPEDWFVKMEISSARGEIPYGAFAVSGITNMDVELPSGGHPSYPNLIRYRALFYQDSAAIRTFRLTGFPFVDNTQTIFLLDGEPSDAESDDPLTIKRELRPGLHEIQVWRNESRAKLTERKPTLLCDQPGQEELAPCPDSMFDPSTFPEELRETIDMPATITESTEIAAQYEVVFGPNTQARLVRLAIVGNEGVAPAIEKITLTDREGKQRLPVESDYQTLRSNQQLEVLPGDQITVRYEDDRTVTERRSRQERRLGVAYNTATISASFLNYEMTEEGRKPVFEDIRRFKLDDNVAIVVTDPDMDQSPDRDVLLFTVTATNGTPVTLEALETEPHSGVFLGRVFPVASEPSRKSDIQVPEGGTLTATYRDMENLDPGIPTDRSVTIEHARFETPTLSLYNIDSTPLPPPTEEEEDASDETAEDDRGPEIVQPRMSLNYTIIDSAAKETQNPRAVIGASLRFDVVARHLAFAESSSITAYVQTDAGRKAFASSNSEIIMPFDVNVPGTLKLTGMPSKTAETVIPPGYLLGTPASAPTNTPPLDEGRFSFTVPLFLDDLPSRTYADESAKSLPSSQIPDALAVRPGDRVHIGFAYEDQAGEVQWHTATVTLESHAFIDVMNGRYRRTISNAYVGEKLYVRLIDAGLDTSPDRDVATINIKADSGATTAFQLLETLPHGGEFKGAFTIGYADKPAPEILPSVLLHGFPVIYGDQIIISYQDAESVLNRSVTVNKGANGAIEPFSKRYTDDSVAIQTTFTLAECFFELAKQHRKMDQESLARREMGHAQKLLAEAVASHQDDALRAHAEYLLGNLAQEYADLSKNEASKKLMYQDALARFSKIPLDYPDTEFAPKAQFKKALVYEKMDEVDIAVEEYVKLAYKYPDHELIPSVMSRLGSYFQKQGLDYKTQAEALEKKENDEQAAGEALRLRELATKEYLNAAGVFAKLEQRFPDNPLAELAGLRSAQNYMRAGDFKSAVERFQKVIDTEKYDGKTIRAQAIYWCGLSKERLSETTEAYQLYRRVTFDFPDSVWAKYARGRLADPVFERIIMEEEKAREQLLDSLKKR